jgi:hypothetical protein
MYTSFPSITQKYVYLKEYKEIYYPNLYSLISVIRPGPRLCECFRNKLIFYGEELLAPRPTPKLEDHPLSAVRDCLFNIFTASLHTGGRLREVGWDGRDWIDLAQDRDRWRAYVHAVMNLRVP